jgi:hypothetical protein
MRLMQLAHNIYRLVSRFVLIAALAAPMVAQEVTMPVIDLTVPPPREQQVSAVAGASIGGIGGQPLPRGYLLPLKIELTSINPQPVKLGDKFTVEVRLRNTSASAFFLPISQNGVAVLQREGKGRRAFLFNLVFEDLKSGRQTSSIVAVAMGAETVKDSLLRIEPGKEVRVLFTGDIGPIAGWLQSDLDRIQIRAGASELTFEDVRYFLKSQSQQIMSDNAESIGLKGR